MIDVASSFAERKHTRRAKSKSVEGSHISGMLDDLIKLEDLTCDTIRDHLLSRFKSDVIYVCTRLLFIPLLNSDFVADSATR